MSMPRFQIAVSKKVTKCDTIWYAENEGIYLATDGTAPSQVDEPWECYQLDIDRALREGVGLEMDAYNFPIIFPRPENEGMRDTRMTPRMLMHLLFHCWKTGKVPRGEYFRLKIGNYVFRMEAEAPLELDKLQTSG